MEAVGLVAGAFFGLKAAVLAIVAQAILRAIDRTDRDVSLDAISALETPTANGLPMKLMGAFKRAVTIGATVSPAFKFRNLIRDGDYNAALSVARAHSLRRSSSRSSSPLRPPSASCVHPEMAPGCSTGMADFTASGPMVRTATSAACLASATTKSTASPR